MEDKNCHPLIEQLNHKMGNLVHHMERLRIDEYLTMWSKPARFMFLNFLAGIMRGLGMALGMTVIFALLLIVMSKMINIPVIGFYVAEIIKIVEGYLNTGIR